METAKSIRVKMIQTTFIENITESLCLSIGKKDIWLTKLKLFEERQRCENNIHVIFDKLLSEIGNVLQRRRV